MSLQKMLPRILKENPEVAIVLAEVLAPPPSLSQAPRPWER
jgi:hypothetical protein